MDKLEFPVGVCPKCLVRGPLFMESVDLSTEDESFTSNIDILICPECDFIVNSNSDFEVEWFDIEDAKYFGYKAVENE